MKPPIAKTYIDYVCYCRSRGLKPMPLLTFTQMRKAGYNPFTTSWS